MENLPESVSLSSVYLVGQGEAVGGECGQGCAQVELSVLSSLMRSLLGCVISVLYSLHHCEAHVCDHRVTGRPDPCPVPRMLSSPGCCPDCRSLSAVFISCVFLCVEDWAYSFPVGASCLALHMDAQV